MKLISLRGANTVAENTPEAIDQASLELMNQLIQVNDLRENQVVSVVFSATTDLDARYPSVILRDVIGWRDTAILNLGEMRVEDQLPCCIRVLITLHTNESKERYRNIYLNGAAVLRPDWQGDERKDPVSQDWERINCK